MREKKLSLSGDLKSHLTVQQMKIYNSGHFNLKDVV